MSGEGGRMIDRSCRALAVLDALSSTPGGSSTELGRVAGCSESTARKHLRALVRSGAATRTQDPPVYGKGAAWARYWPIVGA